MYTLRLKFVTLTIAFLLTKYTTSISQERAPQIDLAELKLEIANTEIVDKISGRDSTLTPKEGQNLFVVTLKGTCPKSGHIILNNSGFQVIYDVKISQQAPAVNLMEPADAYAKGDEWDIPQKGGFSISTFYIDPGPIIIKIAVLLSKDVNSFFVCYPALAKGKATISKKAADEPQK